ncbi:MAG: hypothetical protein CMF50_01285 [Legionellales bacterium]|nr:hypothetical protein [Legionellales bacterium]|tara:strand:- start:1509 stop:2954 length:1446 start_codon:yes stop_codon:yes gene_type:complete
MATQLIEKKEFIGRTFEMGQLTDAVSTDEASVLIVYGRRRVGKTELIEHTLGQRHLVKLEGIENGDREAQLYRVVLQLSKALGQPHLSKMVFSTWFELFDFMADCFAEGEWTLYFEEVQWLAEYKDEFIADLKYAWDNRFRHNPNLAIVLCGSSPSFMINHIVHSKALYNRSTYELHLREFSLQETRLFMSNRSIHEVMDAYLTVGGIPEYLKRLSAHSSVKIGICELSFKQQGFLSHEYQKIFISSFADNVHYQSIIEFLSRHKFATRKEIEKHLKVTGGGKLTDILSDLELCGFIERYVPYQASKNSLLVRYCITDNYLQFYYKFIHPIADKVSNGDYNENPMQALNNESYTKWLGFAFERFCRKFHRIIAKILGFSAVQYSSGVFFNRETASNQKGYQIDLIFDRADKVLTICEIKYLQGKAGADIIDEFEDKLNALPNRHNKTIEKVLITANGASDSLIARAYFDRIITLEDIFTVS